MENFPGAIPEQPDDEEETGSEKKAKKDGKELIKKASILELLQGPEEKSDKKTEKPETAETEKQSSDEQTEKLDESEQKVAQEQIVEERLELAQTELESAPSESDTEASAIAAATFLEKVGEKLDKGEALDEQALDDATAEAAEELGLPPEEVAAETDAEPASEIVEEPGEDDDATIPTPVAGGGGAAAPPPVYPSPAAPAPGSGPVSGGAPLMPIAQQQPNFNALQVDHDKKDTEEERRHSHVPYVVAGGLVGYLIGRRRGRIKTEKRLLPVQEKLKEQVADLQSQIVTREETIRRLGARHRQELFNKDRQQALAQINKEKTKRTEALKVYEKSLPSRPEKFGKLVLNPNVSPEKPKLTEALSDKQIIEIAQKIQISGTDLETLYKRGRISAEDVKEIVKAYLRGESYEKLIENNLKPEKYEQQNSSQASDNQQPVTNGASRLAELLPELHGIKPAEELRFNTPKKESHIATRLAIVGASVVVVVLLAVIIALWLLGSL